MTNSSPPNPQPSDSSQPPTLSKEERRARQNIRMRAYRDNSEEWIAGLVAFGVIGAILFWSLGGRKNDFNMSQSGFLSSSSQTTETETSVNLDSENFSNTDGLNILNAQDSSEEIRRSDSISLGSAAKGNPNQENNYFRSLNPVAAIPSITKADIPKTTPEEEISELESESEVVTESETEPEIAATETESTPEVETSSVSAFSDVSTDYWAYPFLSKLGEEKLLPESESFEPDAPITRAGMAGLISHAFQDNPEIESTKQFKDVPTNNSEVVTDINKAVATGFMNGYSEGNFSPEQNIPRYQVLVALATGLKLDPSGSAETILQNFGDREELPEWSLDKVAAATEAGLAVNREGFALTSLNPNESATRAEVAAMIYQTLTKSGRVPEIESEYIVPTP